MYNVSPQALSTLGFDTGALSDLGLLIRLDHLSVSPKDPHICAASVLGCMQTHATTLPFLHRFWGLDAGPSLQGKPFLN